MTRASYLMAIRKLIASYKKKYDVFGNERKKPTKRKKMDVDVIQLIIIGIISALIIGVL